MNFSFTSSLIITRINGINFNYACGFNMFIDSNTTNYITDFYNHRVIVFSKNWKYSFSKKFDYPYSIISKNNYLFIIAHNYIYKTDKYLNLLKQVSIYAPIGIYSNSNSNYLYVVSAYNNYLIYQFDINLNLINYIPIESSYNLQTISGNKNRLYIGCYGGQILIVENQVVVKNFNGCNGAYDYVTSITFDQHGYMATTCYYSNQIHIYDVNGFYTNKSVPTSYHPRNLAFDSQNMLVLVTDYQITFYSENIVGLMNSTTNKEIISPTGK